MEKEVERISFWHECFRYEESEGVLYWKTRPDDHFSSSRYASVFNTRFAGRAIRSIASYPYARVNIGGVFHPAHRIIWEMHHGVIPEGVFIDHIDRNESNNTLANLRMASSEENSRNCKISVNNTSGHKGVSWVKRISKWRAYIVVRFKQIHLGYFTELEDAVAAYKEASLKLHGMFSSEASDKLREECDSKLFVKKDRKPKATESE